MNMINIVLPEMILTTWLFNLLNIQIAILNETDLPWIPEGTYLGQNRLAVHLLLPTNLTPEIPLEWLDHAIITVHGERHYAVDPMHHLPVPSADVLSLDHSCLQQADGFDSLANRGYYERQLMTEWAMARCPMPLFPYGSNPAITLTLPAQANSRITV